MEHVPLVASLLFAALSIYLWTRLQDARRETVEKQAAFDLEAAASAERARLATEENEALRRANDRLAHWEGVADAEDKAREITQQAHAELARAIAEVEHLVAEAQATAAEYISAARETATELASDAKEKRDAAVQEANDRLRAATTQAEAIMADARQRAEEMAGDALRALETAEENERTAKAIRNVINGYGDEYVVPSHSLLDDLAEEVGYAEAGQQLKLPRQRVREMVKTGKAAVCDYAEPNRRDTAVRFVVDAFNGKADSILSRVKHDNAGTLQQEIRDAFALVNNNGRAFRNARITGEYLNLRLEELRWAAVAHEIKLQEREEQRRIKEQIREEEKARREFERAMREAAKEEETLRKAMDRVEAQMAKANDEQRSRLEAQIAELAEKLRAAEDKNQRALSMAQQTRRGHVYIISNVGSFGEHIFKIGLTRRLEPLDRIRELGDSSVPFSFDVHALIFSDDAPALENRLHKHFVLTQVNKVNPRKEFFRVDLSQIRTEIEGLGLKTQWTMAAEAKEYRESLAVERSLQNDAALREAWMSRQLAYDAADAWADEEDEALRTPPAVLAGAQAGEEDGTALVD